MTPRKYNKTTKSRKGSFLALGTACAVLVLVVAIGLNVASAGAGNTSVSTFGLTASESKASEVNENLQEGSDLAIDENSVLTKASSRNIDKAVDDMLVKEEAERRAAEEARIAAEVAKKAQLEALQARSEADAALAGLESIDWTLSHEEFVAKWGARIDAYLNGSNLAGQGRTFAEAAWNCGIDPRVSPAISNTESSKGAHCFLSYNAWGWGSSSWSNWEEAINAHVSLLVGGDYGPMITYSDAQRYCPPNYDHWYCNTISQMALI